VFDIFLEAGQFSPLILLVLLFVQMPIRVSLKASIFRSCFFSVPLKPSATNKYQELL